MSVCVRGPQVSLQDAERKKQELEGNVKNLEKQLTDAVHRQDEMKAELQVTGCVCLGAGKFFFLFFFFFFFFF
jgi:hypothetical protein